MGKKLKLNSEKTEMLLEKAKIVLTSEVKPVLMPVLKDLHPLLIAYLVQFKI